MEKQRMDRRKRFFRAGLLIFSLILLFFPAEFFFAQDGEGLIPDSTIPVEVRTETSSSAPVVNAPWSLFVLVNHPNPREVDVKAPRFPPLLLLERVRTETRFIPVNTASAEAVQGERWTRMEFLFTPIMAGTATILPFEITVNGRQGKTGEINVRIREESVRRIYDPRLRWQGQAPPAAVGERAELYLELTNWDPSKNVPRYIFQGRAPPNAILEESLPEEAGGGAYRYTVYIVPLEGSEVELEPFLFRSDTYTLSVPEIKLAVLPAVYAQDENQGEKNTIVAVSNDKIPFPKDREERIPFLNNKYMRIRSRVRDLWEKDLKAEALAEIRRNERDSLAGRYLLPLRRDMENALGLGFTEDEKWHPFRVSVISWIVAGVLIFSAVSALLVFRPKLPGKHVTSRRYGGFRAVIILVTLLGLALVVLEEGLDNFPLVRPRLPGRTAVLRETHAYRVPDEMGVVNTKFDEGQPVIVGDYSLNWCNAESPDGRSGWVKREAVINY